MGLSVACACCRDLTQTLYHARVSEGSSVIYPPIDPRVAKACKANLAKRTGSFLGLIFGVGVFELANSLDW